MSNLSQFLGGGGGGMKIKSIQRGSVSIPPNTATASATISPVDLSRSVLTYLGATVSTSNISHFPRIELSDNTTVTATRAAGGSANSIVSYELVEFE